MIDTVKATHAPLLPDKIKLHSHAVDALADKWYGASCSKSGLSATAMPPLPGSLHSPLKALMIPTRLMLRIVTAATLLGSALADTGKQCFKGDFTNLAMWKTTPTPLVTPTSKISGEELIVAGKAGVRGRDGGLNTNYHHAFPEQDEVTLEYEVQFPEGIDFNIGGKLFGIYAGSGSCAGGELTDDCASVRIMWRRQGEGIGYAYIHDKDICTRDNVDCSPPPRTFGTALHGDFWFKPGQWHKLQVHVKMNSGSSSDGFIKINLDGKDVVNLDKVHVRNADTVKFHSIMLHNYWGGSTIDWAPPHDTPIKFKNVNVYCGGESAPSLPGKPRTC